MLVYECRLKPWILDSPPVFPLIFGLFSLGCCVADRGHESGGQRDGVRCGDGDREGNRTSAARELCQREGHQLSNIQSHETTQYTSKDFALKALSDGQGKQSNKKVDDRE